MCRRLALTPSMLQSKTVPCLVGRSGSYGTITDLLPQEDCLYALQQKSEKLFCPTLSTSHTMKGILLKGSSSLIARSVVLIFRGGGKQITPEDIEALQAG